MAILGFLLHLTSGGMFPPSVVRFVHARIARLRGARIPSSLSPRSSALADIAKGATFGFAVLDRYGVLNETWLKSATAT